MRLDRTSLHSNHTRDPDERHFTRKSEAKDGSLLLRKGCRYVPHSLELFTHKQLTFRRDLLRSDPRRCALTLVIIQANQLSPKLRSSALTMVTDQIDCNPQQPCIEAALPAKGRTLPVGAQKALLGKSVGCIVVPNQQEDHAVNPTLVLLDDLVKPFERDAHRFRDWLQGCGQCCSQCSLHLYSLRLWIWTNLAEEGLHAVEFRLPR